MTTIVLHGQDTPRLYKRLTKFIDSAKKRGWEIIYDELSPTTSLFGKERLTVFKDYRLFNPKSPLYDTVVVYNEGDLPMPFLTKLKDVKIEKYDLPKVIWKFLDRPTVKLLHEVIKKEPIELVFHLLAKRLRNSNYADELAKIDYEAKTGKSDLLLSLDLFIDKHLE